MDKIIIHVDMDAFFASVEIRDNPKLKDKPVIIGSFPTERGVVSTCSYEARKFGVRSAMNIKEAYKLCPKGIYIHPNYEKYKTVSEQINKIWDCYAKEKERIALDEAYLDVTEKAKDINGARIIAKEIKTRIKEEVGLTCSVGLAYSKIAAKTASEEKKPNGYFEILSRNDFETLVSDRDVSSLYTIGNKTKEKLNEIGIYKIKEIRENKDKVIKLFGKRGEFIVNLSLGIDDRELKEYNREKAKSISREITFQKDVFDFELLKDVLFLLSLCVSEEAKNYFLHAKGVTLKITYFDMKTITRSKIVSSCDYAIEIQKEALKLLNKTELKKVRLIGVGIYSLLKFNIKQLSFDDLTDDYDLTIEKKTKEEFERLKKKYNLDFENNKEKFIKKNEILFKTVEYMRRHKGNLK